MSPASDVLAWIDRRRKAGRGEGVRESYKPWLTVRDVASHGKVYRVLGRYGRVHHYLSGREYRLHQLLEWSDVVTDIREQFPLHDLAETIAIAEELKVRHPRFRRTMRQRKVTREEPLTTDFLVSLADVPGLPPRIAISVKPASDLLTAKEGGEASDREVDRLLEKAEIERRFWTRRGVPFRMVTDHELPEALLFNLGLVLDARSLDGYPVTEADVPALLTHLADHLVAAPGVPLSRVCATADAQLQLRPGTALALVWHAIGTKQWEVDMRERLDADQPMPEFVVRAGTGSVRTEAAIWRAA